MAISKSRLRPNSAKVQQLELGCLSRAALGVAVGASEVLVVVVCCVIFPVDRGSCCQSKPTSLVVWLLDLQMAKTAPAWYQFAPDIRPAGPAWATYIESAGIGVAVVASGRRYSAAHVA